MTIRLKKRRLNSLEPERQPDPQKRRCHSTHTNVRAFIKARLIGNPLTHNKRIKHDYKNLADHIAHVLIRDARKGRYAAIQLLVDCSEGDFLRQKTLNHYIDKIYHIIERYVHDEEALFQIGREFYILKHRRVNQRSPTPPLYPGPQSLDENYHAFPEVQSRIDEHNDRLLNLALVPPSQIPIPMPSPPPIHPHSPRPRTIFPASYIPEKSACKPKPRPRPRPRP